MTRLSKGNITADIVVVGRVIAVRGRVESGKRWKESSDG
jgi:hypothetical protein